MHTAKFTVIYVIYVTAPDGLHVWAYWNYSPAHPVHMHKFTVIDVINVTAVISVMHNPQKHKMHTMHYGSLDSIHPWLGILILFGDKYYINPVILNAEPNLMLLQLFLLHNIHNSLIYGMPWKPCLIYCHIYLLWDI